MSDFLKELDAVRAEISSMQDELKWLTAARLPKAEAAQRIPAIVDLLAAGFDPVVPQLAEIGAPPVKTIERWLNPPADHAGTLLCWLFRDQIEARLLAALDAADYVPGPPAADRPALIKDLQKRLHVLEVNEEALVESAEAAGVEVGRRADVDWSVVLDFDPDGDGATFPRTPGRGPNWTWGIANADADPTHN